MENFNDRAYDAWRTHHWTDEPEPDLPEIDDPRVVDAWEEAEDFGDECRLPRYARVRVKFKPWMDDDYTEVIRYDDYLDEVKNEYANKDLVQLIDEMGKLGKNLVSLNEDALQFYLSELWKTKI
jgi:hypothetical protein